MISRLILRRGFKDTQSPETIMTGWHSITIWECELKPAQREIACHHTQQDISDRLLSNDIRYQRIRQ